jgi:4-alpha-glucanotransferase
MLAKYFAAKAKKAIMTHHAHLCLVLHNHQPVGNFDNVFEQSYQDSYLPFLDVFEGYSDLRISLHTSGPLMLWLAEHHPEYVHRVGQLVAASRIEVIGGPMYVPILTMLPRRDRIGQIRAYTSWLTERLGGEVAGMWMPERVWEASLASDIAEANIQYTVLDDYHFRAAGWNDDQLTGYFVTEDNGQILRVFPGSERLRYLIPFAPAHQSIEYIREVADRHPGAVLVFGDDGEKFGTWPDTKAHVYERGWLRQFFDLLTENRSWINTCTLAEAIDKTPAVGKIFLPNCSYREMTEWALPVDQQIVYDKLVHSSLATSEQWPALQRFVRGGFWRNFQIKYAEAGEMYARMMAVSRRVEAVAARLGPASVAEAQDQLYRGQCNCPYWHGAFGGIYLPHLRNAIYHHLIRSEVELDKVERIGQGPWVEAEADDFNFDGRPEVRLSSDQLTAWFSPHQGGHLYELDVRAIGHNLLATMQRRPEAYHQKVLAGPSNSGEQCESIHDRVVFKQEGLQERLQYDPRGRKSLMDYFFDGETTLQAVQSGVAAQRGDFADLPYEARLLRAAEKIQVRMQRAGNVWGIPISVSKGITLNRGGSELEIAYLLEELPHDKDLQFAIEFNFAGLPSDAEGRYFNDGIGTSYGHLGTSLDLKESQVLGMVDRWLGIEVQLQSDRPTDWWAYPVQTVSQSESGFELVHQSVCVLPHWNVRPDANGRWTVRLRLAMTVDPTAPCGNYLFDQSQHHEAANF